MAYYFSLGFAPKFFPLGLLINTHDIPFEKLRSPPLFISSSGYSFSIPQQSPIVISDIL